MRNAGARCPDDLLARSRRGPLSPVERRALDAHLGVCALCRAAVALGTVTDGIPDLPGADDEAVVARLAGRVLARSARRPPRARPVAIAAGLALTALAGAAAAWIASRRAPPPASRASIAAPPPSATTVVPIAPPAAPTAGAIAAAPPSSAHRRSRPAPAIEPLGPDRLFAEANAARGAGDLRAAASRYELLERRYPESPEAAVSLVSAGDLLARQGDPGGALDRFERYLAQNAHGPLAPEALFGRARCLRQLGRADEERRAWQDLLDRFPGSLYEGAARRRVNELSR